MKGLEALEYLKRERRRHWVNGDKSLESLETIEKELKALEIINNKQIDVALFDYDYRFGGNSFKLTTKEYELLKEVLL